MSALAQPTPPALLPDLMGFVNERGRLPRLGDDLAPWRYRGWLLWYVIQLHALVPAVGDRWGYHLRTLEAGELLDEPIPQITFAAPDRKAFSLLHEWAKLIGWDCGGWSDFRTLLDWLLWGLALSREEPRLDEKVNESLYRRVDLTPILQTPWDYLGDHVATSKARGWNPTGFYPTPHPFVEAMIRLTMHDASEESRDQRTVSVCDPCVGSGRMLLHASNFSLNLHGQDIDPFAVSMTLINGSLYAPWISFPLPDAILGPPSVSGPTRSNLPILPNAQKAPDGLDQVPKDDPRPV